jgi:hypothetical protein
VALVSPERMVVWDFDEGDPNVVGIHDPHLDQAPCLAPRFAENCDPGVQQSAMLG